MPVPPRTLVAIQDPHFEKQAMTYSATVVQLLLTSPSDWWEALTALGTVGAVVVALLLAGAERSRRKKAEGQLDQQRTAELDAGQRAIAELVSAWVDVQAVPSVDATHYVRKATVHVENQSDSPAYNANICMGVQNAADRWTPVGPLAVPLPLPVLPPKSNQTWDITLPLMACSVDLGGLTYQPAAAIAFSDPTGQRWARGFDSTLERRANDGDAALFDLDADHGDEQIGMLDNPFNPISIVIAFLAGMQNDAEPGRFEMAKTLVDPAASGWASMDDEAWQDMRDRLSSLGVAAHVQYPAPRIAYVKGLTDEAADATREGGAGYVIVPMTLFTLRFIRGAGWRVFGVGAAVRADEIEFPEGDLDEDPRTS